MNKKPLTILPTNQLLQQIWDYIISRPGKKGETKKAEHECLFLLCWKAGLRITEAIAFDLNLEHQNSEYKGLYLLRGKRAKERWIYVSPEIIKELKKRNWKPNNADRKVFFYFLQQVKKELNISQNIELTPHTLRRCFATYNALNGVPYAGFTKIIGTCQYKNYCLLLKRKCRY